MTTVEKMSLAINNKYLTLFKEGLFYKCYNEDAMVFVKNVKEYKVSKKFVKNVGADVYSIGFPVSEVEKGKLTLEFITGKIAAKSFEIKDTEVVFLLNEGDLLLLRRLQLPAFPIVGGHGIPKEILLSAF